MALNFLNDGYFAGKVGIGETNPTEKLEINGQYGKTTLNGHVVAYTRASANYLWASAVGGDLRFTVNGNVVGSSAMMISTAGNVGIGTTLPQTKLAIGSAQGSGIDFLYDATNNYKNQIKNYWNSGTDTRMDFNIGRTSGATPVTVMSVGYNGNVGIGTTSPVNKQQNKYTSVAINSMTATAGTASTNWNRNAGLLIEESNSSNGLALGVSQTANDRKSWIQSGHPGSASNNLGVLSLNPLGGNVGIGTVSPAYNLVVSNGGASGVEFAIATATGLNEMLSYNRSTSVFEKFRAQAKQFEWYTDATANALVIQSGGNVGIGTTAPSQKLHISGNMRLTGAFRDGLNSQGAANYVLTSTGSNGTRWVDASGSSIIGGPYLPLAGGTLSGPGNLTIEGTLTGTTASFNSGATNVVASFTSTDGIAGIKLQDSVGNVELSASGNTFQVQPAGGVAALSVTSTTATFAGDVKIAEASNKGQLFFGTANTDYEIKGGGNYGYLSLNAPILRFDTGGSERMRIDASGNVGILTTSMLNTGSNRGSLTIGGSTAGTINIGNGSINFGIYATAAESNTYSLGVMKFSVGSGFPERMRINSAGDVLIGNTVVNPASGFSTQKGFGYDTSTGNLEVASTSGTPMTIGRNETDAGEILELRKESNIIHSFGSTDSYLLSNVGIGTTSPNTKLDVNGVVVISPNTDGKNTFMLTTGAAIDDARLLMKSVDTVKVDIQANGFSYFNGGNVGIGTTSPSEKLTLQLNTQNQAFSGKNGTDYLWFLRNEAGAGARQSGRFQLMDTDVTTVNIESASNRNTYFNAGNVGIGTTSPTQKLHVAGNARVTGAYYDSNNSPGTANQVLISTVSGTDWVDGSAIPGVPGGSGTLRTIPMWTPDGDTLGNSVLKQDVANQNIGLGITPETGMVTYVAQLRIGEQSAIQGHTDGVGADSFTVVTTNWKFSTSGAQFINGTTSAPGYANMYQQQVGEHTFLCSTASGVAGGAITSRMQMVIKQTGNVGIGTSSPGTLHSASYGTTRLHIDGGTDRGQMIIEGDSFAGIVLSDNGATANQRVFATSVDETKYTIKPLNDNGSSTALGVAFTVLHGGNVGIGATTPGVKLEVEGSTNAIIKMNSTSGTGGRMDFAHTGTNYGNIGSARNMLGTGNATDMMVNGDSVLYLGVGAQHMTILSSGNVGIGTTNPTYKLTVSGGIEAGGLVTYSKVAGSLNTTGYAVAGLTAGFNGASAGFEFKCYGSNSKYQRVVYSCHCSGTTWVPGKVIDEGTNDLDVVASANGATITFTFKARSSAQNFSPRVVVQATGHSINSTYA